MDVIVVAAQGSHAVAGGGGGGGGLFGHGLGPSGHAVPQPDGLVVGSAGEDVAVGGPGQAAHAGHVPDQGVHVGARHGVPELDGAIGGGGGDELAVGRDAHLRHGAGVAVEGQHRLVVWLGGFAGRGAGLCGAGAGAVGRSG